MLQVQDPVAVIGDIHGQFYDMVHLLEVISTYGTMQYLFLGDYVDRGHYCLEVMVVLMALKINHPTTVHLLRGNHETRQMATAHSFRQEILQKTNDQEVFNAFMTLFDALPIAAILNGRFFCVHGGISPTLQRIEDLNKINRFVEIQPKGTLTDLVWSDPVDREDGHLEDVWAPNKSRGTSYFFGAKATANFLRANNLQTVLRAHECVFDGYREFYWGAPNSMVTTVFSAANYTDIYKNLGAVMVLKNGKADFKQYLSTPHPYSLQKSRDLFDFTLTILSTKRWLKSD